MSTEKPYIIYCRLCSASIAMPVVVCECCNGRTDMTDAEVAQYHEFEDVHDAIKSGLWHIEHLDDPIKNPNTKLLVDIWVQSGKTIMECLEVQRKQLRAVKA